MPLDQNLHDLHVKNFVRLPVVGQPVERADELTTSLAVLVEAGYVQDEAVVQDLWYRFSL